MASDKDQVGVVGPLSLSVMKVADEPTPDNQSAFYNTFVKSRVGVRVPAEFGTVPSGEYITTSNNRLSVPLARLPDGKPVLLVLADVDKLAQLEKASTFMELDAKDIIAMAIQNNIGIIVQASPPGREAWAGISANDVAGLSRF